MSANKFQTINRRIVTVRCPRCGSEGFTPCVTERGYDCPDHAARKKAALAKIFYGVELQKRQTGGDQ